MTNNSKRNIEPLYRDLGLKIRQARENKGLTQGSLGNALQPSSTRASIANIESGNQRVLVHTLVQIADTLNVEIEYLLPEEPINIVKATNKAVEKELKQKLGLSNEQVKKITQSLSNTSKANKS